MKLKRIISALVVFTMVMTCAVCSVSADATYQAYTSYDVATGELTVNAKIAGATDGSMVSYIIYGDDDAATTDAVSESTIVHIDQATVTDGAASFDAVTADYDKFKNRKFQFVSTDDVLTRYNNGGAKSTYAESLNTITDVQKSVTFFSQQTNSGSIHYTYLKDGVPYYVGSHRTNSSNAAETWLNETVMAEADLTAYPKYCITLPLEDVDAYVVRFEMANNRQGGLNAKFNTYAGNFAGRTQTAANGSFVYQSLPTKGGYDVLEEGRVNKLVANTYKDDITDGEFAGHKLQGGDLIGVDIVNNPGHGNASDKYKDYNNTVLYATVDSMPVVGKYTNANGTFDAVTFLCTPAAGAAELEKGLNIYRYELKANSAEEAAGEFDFIASCPSPVEGTGKFGIQLFDGTNSGELDATKYGFLAVPYLVINGVKTELSVFGDNGVGAAPEEGQARGDVFYYSYIYTTAEEPAE